MRKNQPVATIMTADPLHVEQGEKLSQVRGLLTEHNIHHMPVTHGGKLVGMISATDMMKLSFEAFGTDPRAVDAMLDHHFQLAEVMHRDPAALHERDTVRSAAERLSEAPYHSLPIVDDARKLVGIVTSTDLIGYLLEQY